MKISACPKCGSKRIEMGTMGAGVTFGVTSWKSVCKDCGYQGEPLLFDSEKEYEKFIQGMISKEIEQTSVSVEEEDLSHLSKKDEEVVGLLKEDIKEEDSQQENTKEDGVFPVNKSWRNEVVVSLIVATAGIIISASNLIESPDLSISIFYGILLFVVTTFGALFVIVIIEYAYLGIKKMSKQKKLKR